MKEILLILVFVSCGNDKIKLSEKISNVSASKANQIKSERKLQNDSTFFNDRNLQQFCVIFSKPLNDSLQREFEKANLRKQKFLNIGTCIEILDFNRTGNYIRSNFFFQSFRDAVQKVQVENVQGGVLYLKMKLWKDGKDDRFWIHQIGLSYYDPNNAIKKIELRC